MWFVLGLVGAFLGAGIMDEEGLVFGFVLGVLTGALIVLKKRVSGLEKQQKWLQDKLNAEHIEPVKSTQDSFNESGSSSVPVPVSVDNVTSNIPDEEIDVPAQETDPWEASATVAEEPESRIDVRHDAPKIEPKQNLISKIENKIREFFTTGNVVVKIGVIILFFGISFLLKYAADRTVLPIELRLASVCLVGLIMLIVGWRLRLTRMAYGLVLQGGGVGVLFLTVFSAAKLYSVVPTGFAFVLMILLVLLAAILAILQDSRSLAVFGIIGGFLAPILTSSGSGSHVMLFSYYALLNAGIFGVAWFKSWRILNWFGFVFTFVISSFWGFKYYQADYFSTTEPFLILFYVFYLVISVLFAFRQPPQLKGYVDGSLVFGLPLIAFALQSRLVSQFEFGQAITALVMSAVYIFLAKFLWRDQHKNMRVLAESFLALGVIFVSLAVPLALDGRWTASTWALEGAGLVWIGLRQSRLLTRSFGLLLQLGAGIIFLDAVHDRFYDSLPVFNSAYLGTLLISVAALFSSWFYRQNKSILYQAETPIHLGMLYWGLVWWFVSAAIEVDRYVSGNYELNTFMIFTAASSLLMLWFSRRLDWEHISSPTILMLPLMLIVFAISFVFDHNDNPLSHLGYVSWPFAFSAHLIILWNIQTRFSEKIISTWHAIGLSLLTCILSWMVAEWVDGIAGLSQAWVVTAWVIVPVMVSISLMRLGPMVNWPVGLYPRAYFSFGLMPVMLALVIWQIAASFYAGNPRPLSYLPLLNPLDLAQGFVLLIVIQWLAFLRQLDDADTFIFKRGFISLVLGGGGFIWVNAMIARSVHFFNGVRYDSHAMMQSTVFQTSTSIVWSILAMVVMVAATQKASRKIWFVGAGLLGLVVFKLFMIDLSGSGTVERIVSFMVVGGLMLVVGYLSPLPPKQQEQEQS